MTYLGGKKTINDFLFTGMNLNKRELNEHVEFESQTYYAAFAAELEACAQPMWGLLTHCKVKVSPLFFTYSTCVRMKM